MRSRITNWDELETVKVGAASFLIERRRLVQLMFEAAGRTEWPNGLFPPNAVPTPVLRSVVLYCFALDICASEEIVDASEIDPAVNYLCANFALEWQTVHEFRRRTGGCILESLADLFELISSDPQTDRIQAKRRAREEAEARIRRAVQADSIVLDL